MNRKNRGGRPKHQFWERAGFELRKVDDKSTAFCTVCVKNLRNTAQHRLKAHRKSCKYEGLSDSELNDSVEDRPKDTVKKSLSSMDWKSVSGNGDYEVVYTITTSENDANPNAKSPKVKKARLSDDDSPSNVIILGPAASLFPDSDHDDTRTLSSDSPKTVRPRSNLIRPRKRNASSTRETLPPEVREQLDASLARLFHGCHIPASVVESRHFRDFVARLEPSYRLPSRKTLTSSLLARAYEKITLSNREVVLLVDDWVAGSTNVGLSCTVQTWNEETFFLDTYELVNRQDDATGALFEVVEDAVRQAREKYEVNVYAVVSNGGSRVSKMWRAIDLWHATCNKHSVECLVDAILDRDLAGRVDFVLRQFMSPDLENAIVERNGRPIVVAEDEHWHGHRNAFSCLVRNLNAMREIAEEGIYTFDSETPRIILDEGFELQVRDTLAFLDTICTLMMTFQKPEANLADAVEMWLRVDVSKENERFQEAFRETLADVVNPYALTANYLHPVFGGEQFQDNDTYSDMVDDFLLAQLDETGLTSLNDFRERRGIFARLFDKSIRCPRTFWSLARRKHGTLSHLAQKLFRIPASKS